MISQTDIDAMTETPERREAGLLQVEGMFRLGGDARLTQRCATEDCAGQPIYRFERDGIGSNYCSGCAAALAQMESNDG